MLMSLGPYKVLKHILNTPGAIVVWARIIGMLSTSYWIPLKLNQRMPIQHILSKKHCGQYKALGSHSSEEIYLQVKTRARKLLNIIRQQLPS